MRRLCQAAVFGCLLLVLTGCLRGGAQPFPVSDTMEGALAGPLSPPIEIAYQEPFGPGRAMVLYRNGQEGLSATILEQAGRGWRMTDAVIINSPLARLGSLSYGRHDLGRVEKQVGSATYVSPEANVIFGETFDPAITWVEVTLDAKGAPPIRTQVRDGIWAVIVPPEHQWTGFFLHAGDGQDQRFAASVGRQGADLSAETAPLVEYQDKQLGLHFLHPDVGPNLRLEEPGRLTLQFSLWTITMERTVGPVTNPEAQLVAAATGEVLEHATQPLNGAPAGYLLETEPDEEGDGTTYHLRYLIPAGNSAYAVTCSTAQVHSRQVWEEHWRPVCDRVLTTLKVGE